MRLYKSPQVRLDDERIKYTTAGDKLTVTINGVSDTFDFTNVVGVLNMSGVRTTLPFNPPENVGIVLRLLRFDQCNLSL